MIDLSIIVVSYNTRSLLVNCLQSIYGDQRSPRTEIFVVDNASSDGSPEMTSQNFPKVHLICNAENRGFAAANDQAIREAKGRYVLLLNSDTVVLGSVLEDSVRYLDEHPDVGVMGCRVLNPDHTLQLTCSSVPSFLNLFLMTTGLARLNWPRWFGRYQMRDWARDSERDVAVVSGCYMMVRAEAIAAVGLLDEAFFFFGEETDWCTRFRHAGWRVTFAPVGEIIHYGSASALSLGHERDVLLTSGLVRYHRKHSGIVETALVWGLLFIFNVSRFLFWTAAWSVRRSDGSKARRNHFWGVIRNYAKTWPRIP